MRNQLRMWGPAAGWAVVLFLLSAWPNPASFPWFVANDKVVHLALYGVMGVALGFGRFWSGSRLPHLVFVIVGALYGATDEWHQMIVPGREPSWSDWVADLAGVILGYTLTMVLGAIRVSHGRAETEQRTT